MKSIELQTVGDGSPVNHEPKTPGGQWLVQLAWIYIFEDLLQDLSIGVMNINREHLAFFNVVHAISGWTKTSSQWKCLFTILYSPGIPQLIVFIVLFCVRTIVVARIYQQQLQGTLLLNGMNHLRRNSENRESWPSKSSTWERTCKPKKEFAYLYHIQEVPDYFHCHSDGQCKCQTVMIILVFPKYYASKTAIFQRSWIYPPAQQTVFNGGFFRDPRDYNM